MTDAELFSTWTLWLAVAGVLVLVAAGLLIGVWLSARRILKLAGEALDAVREIRDHTDGIWALETTNRTALGILDEAESIREHAGEVAGALTGSGVS